MKNISKLTYIKLFSLICILAAAVSFYPMTSNANYMHETESKMHPFLGIPINTLKEILALQGITAPRVALPPAAPVTKDSIPLAIIITGVGTGAGAGAGAGAGTGTGNIGILFDFDEVDFATSDVNQLETIIPVLLSLLEGAGVNKFNITTFSPSSLAVFGDAQGVHNFVVPKFIGSFFEAYIRVYATKEIVAEGNVTRFSAYLWTGDGAITGEFVGAFLLPESLFSLFTAFAI